MSCSGFRRPAFWGSCCKSIPDCCQQKMDMARLWLLNTTLAAKRGPDHIHIYSLPRFRTEGNHLSSDGVCGFYSRLQGSAESQFAQVPGMWPPGSGLQGKQNAASSDGAYETKSCYLAIQYLRMKCLRCGALCWLKLPFSHRAIGPGTG